MAAEQEERTGPRLHHVGYVVPDLDKAIAFYTETLGLPLHRRADAGAGLDFEVAVFRHEPAKASLTKQITLGVHRLGDAVRVEDEHIAPVINRLSR